MSYYDDIFKPLDSEVRLRAIVEEMETNHPRSDLACRFLMGGASNFRFPVASLKERLHERELWVRLADQLLEPIPPLGELIVGSANSAGIQRAILISQELGESIEANPKAVALVDSILKAPESFRAINFDGSGRNSWPVVPFGFVHLIAKFNRLSELPMPILVSSVLGGPDWFASDEEMKELLSSIPQDRRSQFSESIREHLNKGWEIPNNQAFADCIALNENDRPALEKLLREKAALAEKGMFGDGQKVSHYLELANRLEEPEKPVDPKPNTAADKNSDAKFNRAAFEEWLEILKDERNPKLLGDAIQAVVTLAKNGESYDNNGQTSYHYVDPVERAAQLAFLNRTMSKLKQP